MNISNDANAARSLCFGLPRKMSSLADRRLIGCQVRLRFYKQFWWKPWFIQCGLPCFIQMLANNLGYPKLRQSVVCDRTDRVEPIAQLTAWAVLYKVWKPTPRKVCKSWFGPVSQLQVSMTQRLLLKQGQKQEIDSEIIIQRQCSSVSQDTHSSRLLKTGRINRRLFM